MTARADVIVVGGGIAGLTVALAAAERGLSSIVIDEPRIGSASRAAAGMLAPSLEGLPARVAAAAIAARDEYPAYIAMLRERTGIDVPLDRNGILELATSAADLEQKHHRAGDGAQVFDAEDLAHLEPAFRGHAGGVLHPSDGAVDNVTLMDALAHAVRAEARITLVNDAALRRRQWGGQFVETRASVAYEADHVVIAGGAWVGWLDGLPRAIPVEPLHGQLLTLDGCPIGHVTYGGGGYLVPRGGRLLIGATSERTGHRVEATGEGRGQLCAIAGRAIPSLATAAVADHWAGLRPVSPDAMPILGTDPDDPAVVYACGFSRNGILFAPWAARQLASLLAGERADDALDSFSIGRFGGK